MMGAEKKVVAPAFRYESFLESRRQALPYTPNDFRKISEKGAFSHFSVPAKAQRTPEVARCEH
jgi:hypothetical protein